MSATILSSSISAAASVKFPGEQFADRERVEGEPQQDERAGLPGSLDLELGHCAAA
jgi:hypothetical protein